MNALYPFATGTYISQTKATFSLSQWEKGSLQLHDIHFG